MHYYPGVNNFNNCSLSRFKKEEKGEPAAREISEILPHIEYELHYRLLQKLRLRGMNAIFGLSLQLAFGENLVTVLASGTGVYIPALPGSWLPKDEYHSGHPSCEHENPEESPPISKADQAKDHVSPTHIAKPKNTIEFAGKVEHTYVIDTRAPEPEELSFLLNDPLPPPGMLVMTTDYPTNGENRAWFSEFKPRKCVNTSSASNWRSLHTFVKVHSIPSLKPDDALGLAFFKPSGGGQMFTDTSSPAAHHSSSHSDTPTNLALINDCLTTCLRDCNQLTWFHFRCLMPCAIVALRYRLNITDDDAVQILCSGFTLSPSCEESTLLPNPLSAYVKPEGQKSATSTRRSLFNRPKNLRSIAEIEKKTLRHLDTLEINYSKKSATQAYYKKAKWWKSFPKETWIKSQENSQSRRLSSRTSGSASGPSDINKSGGERCLLTPLSSLPNHEVTHYLGNYSFYFVRETTDLREIGGQRSFIHAAVMEAQSVIAAHTVSLGGNALLSYHVSELLVNRPTSRNQAQCLIHLSGDMVRSKII
uniref:C2 domain-containing protein n=2 Tax=Mesocestoides corti TaxID=53468 RepID=A0A5K3FD07_MESCO